MTPLSALIGAPLLVLAVGALGFLFSRKKPLMPAAKTKLSVQLDVKDYKRLRIWADKQGITLSEYVRKTLLDSVPIEERKKVAESERSSEIIDRAFDELDLNEPPYTGVFPMPPARKPQNGVVTEADRIHPAQRVTKLALTQVAPNVPPGPHPCVHLTSASGPAHLQGQCQGECNQTSQRGRPCFWTPTTARNCPVYEPKMTGSELRMAR